MSANTYSTSFFINFKQNFEFFANRPIVYNLFIISQDYFLIALTIPAVTAAAAVAPRAASAILLGFSSSSASIK